MVWNDVEWCGIVLDGVGWCWMVVQLVEDIYVSIVIA